MRSSTPDLGAPRTEPGQEGPQRLGRQDRDRVYAALAELAENDQGDIKRLKNTEPPEWRLRVGDVRVRYAYLHEDQAILVLRVLPRGKAYDR